MSVHIPTLNSATKIKHYYGFKYLLNSSVHTQIYNKLQLQSSYKMDELKVLDLYPGPSQHSAIFQNIFNPKQYVLMDSRPDFVKFIQDNFAGTNMELYQRDPYEWSSYTDMIEKEKRFVPSRQSRDKIHNQFLVMANLTGMIGEGLFMQWLSCIGNKNWLQRFGRVKMLVWVPEATAHKVLARPGSLIRAKCSVVTEAFTDTKLVATSDSGTLKKFSSSLLEEHDPIIFSTKDTWLNSGKPISLLEVNPIDHDIDLDNWDYVTKHLLILKSTPLHTAIDSLGHGGKQYFSEKVEDKLLMDKCPKDLTNKEFVYLTSIFNNWPFKPDIYMDFIDVFQENE